MLEEEEKCYVCDRSGEEVKLFDAISGEEIIKLCENCSLTENIPIIRRPTSFQLKEAERPYTVYERLARAAGLTDKAKEAREKEIKEIEKKTASIIARGISLDNLRKPRDFRKIGDTTIEMIREEKPISLIDNYHWYLQRARRARGLTTKQLADSIGEAEMTIKMIEHAQLPGDYERVIRKIQQFLRIDLEKGKFFEKEQKPKNLDLSPVKKEETLKIVEEIKPEELQTERKEEKKELKFDIESTKKLTIYDLYKLKEAKEKEEKQKKIQEEIEKGGIAALKLSGIELKEEPIEEKEVKEISEYEEKKSMNFFKRLFKKKKKEEVEVEKGE